MSAPKPNTLCTSCGHVPATKTVRRGNGRIAPVCDVCYNKRTVPGFTYLKKYLYSKKPKEIV
jgi:hypothetical protein